MPRVSNKELIEKNLAKIKEWAAAGLTNKEIAGKLGISESCFYKHKADIKALKDNIETGRKEAVEELENTLFKSAVGYVRKVKKYEKIKRCIYENGKKAEEWEEMAEYEVEEYIKPDITAGIFLLKNWAKYMNEPKLMELRQKEIDLRTKQVENNIW